MHFPHSFRRFNKVRPLVFISVCLSLLLVTDPSFPRRRYRWDLSYRWTAIQRQELSHARSGFRSNKGLNLRLLWLLENKSDRRRLDYFLLFEILSTRSKCSNPGHPANEEKWERRRERKRSRSQTTVECWRCRIRGRMRAREKKKRKLSS